MMYGKPTFGEAPLQPLVMVTQTCMGKPCIMPCLKFENVWMFYLVVRHEQAGQNCYCSTAYERQNDSLQEPSSAPVHS